MEVPGPASQLVEPTASGEAGSTTHVTAILDLLLTVGYIDGVFDPREQTFVRQYIDSVLLAIDQSAAASERAMGGVWRGHFNNLYRRLDAEIALLAAEGASTGDNARLRQRAVERFSGLPGHEQKAALETLEGLIHADGVITAPEKQIQQELMRLYAVAPPANLVASPDEPTVTAQLRDMLPGSGPQSAPLLIHAPVKNELVELSHPLLDPLEQTLSPHPVERQSQIEWDYQLVQRAMMKWQQQRAGGAGRLSGIEHPEQIPPGARFLDGYIYVHRPTHPVELVVLGDLHGCYSCLKAALLQSNFIQRAWAHQWDPGQYPDVKLVLLGDYIDRGLYSFDGVLRAALQLFVAMPDQVILLRGNHEYLMWFENELLSCVHPAEALASIKPHVPVEMLEAYRLLFEHMPTSFLCDQTMFVHGGIPRDDTFADRYRDLSSLNHPDLRFQMMWSDPANTQHIPVERQRKNPRFSFGHDQFRSFMERTGLRAMVRGHEKIEAGFRVVYDTREHQLLSLFSAGGEDNSDLPPGSSYRRVKPMALTMQYGRGAPTATPWLLDYQPFNYPPHNGLYRPHPVLEFRYV